jgi:hypothetical protein
LENARFLLEEDTISGFEQIDNERTYHNAIKSLAYLLSSQQTGVCDELMSLLSSDVLRIDAERGIPILAFDWYTKVDALLLLDMHSNWGHSVHLGEKFGIIDEIRKLSEHWERTEQGWLLKEEGEEVFVFEELDEWRDAFEENHQSRIENSEGIGRFY